MSDGRLAGAGKLRMSATVQANAPHTVKEAVREGRRDWLASVEFGFDTVIEAIVALLVAAEIVLLFVSIIMRYVFSMPLVWSDELASTMFIWLAMLGATVALRRGQHMRMTAVVSRCGRRTAIMLEAFATTIALALLFLLIGPAIEYATEEGYITTPALEISNVWRASALPVGFVLLSIGAFLRLARTPDRRMALVAAVVTAAIVGSFTLLGPVLQGLGNLNLVIFFLFGLGVAVMSGVPIAFCFGLATFGYLALTTHTPTMVVVGRMDEGISQLVLLAVPMFIFLGVLIESTGMARAMVMLLANLLRHVRGGLSYVLLGAMYLVSGISGSKIADMAAVAPALFPEMKARGAKAGDLVALLAATGAQTEVIPPSLVLITIGSVTGVSIAALFTGGLLPALVVGIALCAVVWWRYRNEDLSGIQRPTLQEIWKAFLLALPALILPFVIRFAVVEGIATATEVSTVGIFYSIVVSCLFYRMAGARKIVKMLVDTAALSGTILIIIGAATAMAWALAQSGFSRDLAGLLENLPGGAITFLLVSVVVFIVLGSLLEGIPAIVLFGPLLFPIARDVGVHEVHYAIVVVLAMGIGLFAPPFGLGFYAACAIGGVDPDEGMGPVAGYLMALVAGLLIVTLVPWISTGFLH